MCGISKGAGRLEFWSWCSGELGNLRAYGPLCFLMEKASDELICFKHHNPGIIMVITTEFVLFLKAGCYM